MIYLYKTTKEKNSRGGKKTTKQKTTLRGQNTITVHNHERNQMQKLTGKTKYNTISGIEY